MNHPTEEDWILHYYRESEDGPSMEAHLRECDECRSTVDSLSGVLDEVRALPVPEPADDYGARVWKRIEGKLDRPRRRPVWLLVAAAAVVLASTFLAGRLSSPPVQTEIRERILLVALSEHLEKSELLLLEVKNGEAFVERAKADELLWETRLYRQTADRVGDVPTAEVLEELERFLLDVAHGPHSQEAAASLRARIDEGDMMFKLRVLQTSLPRRF